MGKHKKKNGKEIEPKVDALAIAKAVTESMPDRESIELRSELMREPGVAQISKEIEIAYDPEKEHVMFRVEGKDYPVLKTDLWQFVFSTCSAHVRDQMMPVRQTEVMHYSKMHRVQLKRDMRAGETMNVRCEMSVPLTVVEGLKGMVEKETKTGILLA